MTALCTYRLNFQKYFVRPIKNLKSCRLGLAAVASWAATAEAEADITLGCMWFSR